MGLIPIDNQVMLWRQFDSDDIFFHVTCHVEPSLKSKIQNREFVELERLLPREMSVGLGFTMNKDHVMELISKGGQTYFALARDKEKINGVCKWDQAFRVYVAIYSEANPSRAAEIWQYIHVIHRAAAVYNWENVSFYDFTFRQLMATKPWRSWSKTYTQAWNLAMNEPISKSMSNNNSNNSSSSGKDWRDDCCWQFNRNRCKKPAPDCHFDHRCTYCGGWGHGFHNCRK